MNQETVEGAAPASSETKQNAPDDTLRGAEAIAEFIFGDRRHRRKVYYLAECSKVPIYRLGSTLCLRPSVYRNWIEGQEARSISNTGQRSN
jgi:hypothetical protein